MIEPFADSPLDDLLARLVDLRATADDIAALESRLARSGRPPALRPLSRFTFGIASAPKLGQSLPDSSPVAVPPLAMPETDPVALSPGLPGALASTTGFLSRSIAAWGNSSSPMRAAVIGATLSLYFVGLLIAVAWHRGFQVPDPIPDQGQRGLQSDASIARLLEPVNCVWKTAAAQRGSTVAAGEVSRVGQWRGEISLP